MRDKTAPADKVHSYDATAEHTAQSMRTSNPLIPKPPGLTSCCDALGSDDAQFLTLFNITIASIFRILIYLASYHNMPLISF